MGFSQGQITGTVLVLLSATFACISAGRLKFNDNIMVDYTVINSSRSEIEFNVTTVNLTGWIGIGLNEKQGDLAGAELFIGYINGTEKHGADYYGSSSNGFPMEDRTRRDWTLRDIIENTSGGMTQTNFLVKRYLNTSDERDVVIQDKNVFIVWAYNKDNKAVSAGHTDRGNCTVNFISDQSPCSDGNSGNMVGVELSTLLFGLVAVMLKS